MVRNIPVMGPVLAQFYVWIAEKCFRGSASYWENRYSRGGNSGDGSYGELAKFKAQVLNGLVEEYAIKTVIEFGCGDGNQLMLARYPQYLGLDISRRAIDICRDIFHNDLQKSFCLMQDYVSETAEVALSIDVLFHLVEDDVFDRYMRTLFTAGQRLAIIYASNTDVQETPQPPHVRHRRFTHWVEANKPRWSLIRVIDNRFPYDEVSGTGSPASFYIYERRTT
jgi:cyclopropane fatty-acyl-phospholipid synthase-like methyltransferase